MESWTDPAVLADFIWQVFPLGSGETESAKKIGLAREKANALDAMSSRLHQKSFDQVLTATLALSPRCDRNRTNLGEVQAIKMKCATTNDASGILENDEVTDVFADFCQASRQQRAIRRVSADEVVHLLCIRQNRLTRAHSPSRAKIQFSVWHRRALV